MILVDTSGLLSAIDRGQQHHTACAAVLTAATRPLILSPFVLAELDAVVAKRVGSAAQAALLDEVVRGVYRLEALGQADVALARDLITRYGDLRLGLADASIVVLAERYGTRDILTLDGRHFRALRTLDGQRFRVLPGGQ